MATKTSKAAQTASDPSGPSPTQPVCWPDVLTLEETAAYLRLSPPTVEELAVKGSERSALAMVHGPLPRSQSAEVKRYLDGHKPARKGTLQILLVLRGRP